MVLTKEKIDNYEEHWQKQCYFKSRGVYVHCCELCYRTSDVLRIPGGHYVCTSCKKDLKLLKKETIINVGNKNKEVSKKLWPGKPFHPSDPSKREREKNWKKIIKEDYLIEMFNKFFE